MIDFATIRIRILILISVFAFLKVYTQVPTYTVDESFDTEELFKDVRSVFDFHFLSNGRILVGGFFQSEQVEGLGMIYSNGQLDNSWGGVNTLML